MRFSDEDISRIFVVNFVVELFVMIPVSGYGTWETAGNRPRRPEAIAMDENIVAKTDVYRK